MFIVGFRSNQRTHYSHPINANVCHDFVFRFCSIWISLSVSLSIPLFFFSACFVPHSYYMFLWANKEKNISAQCDKSNRKNFQNWTQIPSFFQHIWKKEVWRSIESMNVSYFPYWPNTSDKMNKQTNISIWMNGAKWFVLLIFCTNAQSGYTYCWKEKTTNLTSQ